MNLLMDPRLNADIYRNMTAADRPPVPDKNLQFILVYNENSAVLGGSNMTDRYWSGSVWYFNDIATLNRNKGFILESGVCDGAYLERDKFVVSEDSGVLQVIGLTDVEATNSQELKSLGYTCQHDSSLLTLAVFSDNAHLVTGGMDCCIKVWDVTELLATYSFGYAHTDIVTCVDVQPESNTTFVSTSLDCEALLWDLRQTKPAKSILKKDIGLTSVNWNTVLDYVIAIGTEGGDVTLVDIRNTETVLKESSVFRRSVHRLLFNPDSERSEELACCCDDTFVEVVDTNKDFLSIYKNTNHTDFVRGLAWHKDKLLSCSWDNTLLKHTIHSCDDQ